MSAPDTGVLETLPNRYGSGFSVGGDAYAKPATADDVRAKLDQAMTNGGLTPQQHSAAHAMLNAGTDPSKVEAMANEAYQTTMAAAQRSRGIAPPTIYDNYDRAKAEREGAVASGEGDMPMHPELYGTADAPPSTPGNSDFSPPPVPAISYPPSAISSDTNFMPPTGYSPPPPPLPLTSASGLPATRTYASPVPLGNAPQPPAPPAPPVPAVFNPAAVVQQGAAVAPQLALPDPMNDPLQPYREALRRPGQKGTPTLDKLGPEERRTIERAMRTPQGQLWFHQQEAERAAATNTRIFEGQKFNLEQQQKAAELVRKGEHGADTLNERIRHNLETEMGKLKDFSEKSIKAATEEARAMTDFQTAVDTRRAMYAGNNEAQGQLDRIAKSLTHKGGTAELKAFDEAHPHMTPIPAHGQFAVTGPNLRIAGKPENAESSVSPAQAMTALAHARDYRKKLSETDGADTSEIDAEIAHLRTVAYPNLPGKTSTVPPASSGLGSKIKAAAQ